MRADLGRPVSALGILLVAQTAGYLAATVANGPLVARLGTGRLLAASAGAFAVGLLGYAGAAPWAVLVPASVLVGMAAGGVDAGVNAHVAVHHSRRAMGLLHGAFGVGATAGPLLVIVLLRRDVSWQVAYLALVVAQAALLVVFLVTRDRWQSTPSAPAAAPPAPAGHRRAVMLLTLASFLVYTGLEIATGQWAFSLLTESRGTGATAAGAWVASYWGALTLGRLAMAVTSDRLPAGGVLAVAAVGAVAGTALLWGDPGGAGAAALPLIGISLAPVFPTLVSLTPVRLGSERAAHAIGYQLAAAGVGAAALPGGIAVVIDVAGLEALAPALLTLAVALLGLHAATTATAARPAA